MWKPNQVLSKHVFKIKTCRNLFKNAILCFPSGLLTNQLKVILGHFHLLELAGWTSLSVNGMREFWERSEVVLAKVALLME